MTFFKPGKMSDQEARLCVKSELMDPDCQVQLNFDGLMVFEEMEDACTQTCSSEPQQFSRPQTRSHSTASDESDETDVSFVEIPHVVFSLSSQRRSKHFYKNKSQNTIRMLKEKHRENERLRHHSLNQHLRIICKQVPGSAENGKETKVVMMQRIISYIAYLENTVRYMSSQLGVQPREEWLKLTSSTADMEVTGTWRKEYLAANGEDSEDSELFAKNVSRRQKLSSPQLKSTCRKLTTANMADAQTPDATQNPFLESEESTPASSVNLDENMLNDGWQWFLPEEEVVIDGTANHDVFSSDEFAPDFLETSPLSSLVKARSSGNLGVTNRQRFTGSHNLTVFPDQVIPPSYIKEEIVENTTQSVISVLSRSASVFRGSRTLRLRQASPKRKPFYDTTNVLDAASEADRDQSGHSYSKRWIDREDGKESGKAKPGICTRTMPETCDVIAKCRKRLAAHARKGVVKKRVSNKFDLRKSSWMNGFMMYSRIHRKQLIKEKPGLHVSTISKIMGHAWRAMTSEEKQPYRDQAQVCSQELQRILTESCH